MAVKSRVRQHVVADRTVVYQMHFLGSEPTWERNNYIKLGSCDTRQSFIKDGTLYIVFAGESSYQVLVMKLSLFLTNQVEQLVISRDFVFFSASGILDIKKELCVIEDEWVLSFRYL